MIKSKYLEVAEMNNYLRVIIFLIFSAFLISCSSASLNSSTVETSREEERTEIHDTKTSESSTESTEIEEKQTETKLSEEQIRELFIEHVCSTCSGDFIRGIYNNSIGSFVPNNIDNFYFSSDSIDNIRISETTAQLPLTEIYDVFGEIQVYGCSITIQSVISVDTAGTIECSDFLITDIDKDNYISEWSANLNDGGSIVFDVTSVLDSNKYVASITITLPDGQILSGEVRGEHILFSTEAVIKTGEGYYDSISIRFQYDPFHNVMWAYNPGVDKTGSLMPVPLTRSDRPYSESHTLSDSYIPAKLSVEQAYGEMLSDINCFIERGSRFGWRFYEPQFIDYRYEFYFLNNDPTENTHYYGQEISVHMYEGSLLNLSRHQASVLLLTCEEDDLEDMLFYYPNAEEFGMVGSRHYYINVDGDVEALIGSGLYQKIKDTLWVYTGTDYDGK